MNRFDRVYICQMAASNAKSDKLTIAVQFIPLYIIVKPIITYTLL